MSSAVVLLSGGVDSTVCLFLSKLIFDQVRALSIDYGQRHSQELKAAEKIAAVAEIPWRKIHLAAFSELGGSVLTTPGPFQSDKVIVSGRNIVLLTLAAAYAVQTEAGWIVAGMCGADFSGFPDCRPDFLELLQRTLQFGLDSQLKLYTPLLNLTKAETFRLAYRLPPPCWKTLGLTVTCYEGMTPGCGKCMSCKERELGLAESGLEEMW